MSSSGLCSATCTHKTQGAPKVSRCDSGKGKNLPSQDTQAGSQQGKAQCSCLHNIQVSVDGDEMHHGNDEFTRAFAKRLQAEILSPPLGDRAVFT